MLFEIVQFPKITIATSIDESKVNSLKAGSSYQSQIALSVSLHGVTKIIPANVQVVKLAGNGILVSSIYPIIVNASDFALESGVEALRVIAKLPVISTAVPVSFNLMFIK